MNHYHKKYFFLSMLIEKVLHSKMNKILTNSEAVRDSLVDSESVNKSKIEVIPNFKLVKWSDTNKKRNKKKNKVWLCCKFHSLQRPKKIN